jgi:phosphoglucomutase
MNMRKKNKRKIEMPGKIREIEIQKRYEIKKMGTSGLRQTQEVYNRELFLEQFTQGIADYFREITDRERIAENNKTILLGGDPRKGNSERINTIARVMTANGFTLKIAENGLASTPAMSHGIRELKLAGGIVLTASHNPFTDVGIKINMADGSPALEDTTERIHRLQNSVEKVLISDESVLEEKELVEYVDIVKIYTDLLDRIFRFSNMRQKIKDRGIRGAFDSMYGAAGPFARSVFQERLGIDAEMLRQEPREDLGGIDSSGEPLHPEPDFDYISDLIKLNSTGGYDIVAAWDSDVDRRLDGGNGFFIESADEFALFAEYSELVNIEELFDDTIYFCRSTVTAGTIDLMEEYLGNKFKERKVKTVETPTGFKWIADLGNWGVEESNGAGNPYHREKDGIFATVFLLKIMLHTGKSVKELMEDIWERFGRVYFTRGEVSGDLDDEKDALAEILKNAGKSAGGKFGDLTLESAGEWDYLHPVTGNTDARGAAWLLRFSDGNTIKARFSGTGSSGYTLRVYCTKYDKRYNIPKSEITRPMKDAFDELLSQNGFKRKSSKYTDANQPDPYGE